MGGGYKASLVRINNECLLRVAEDWAKEDFVLPDWRLPVLPERDDEDFIQFLGVSTSLNFCYTDSRTKEKFATFYRGKSWQGAMALNACLMRAIEEEKLPLLDADFLANLKIENARTIFRGNMEIPLFINRWSILKEVGAVLKDDFRGSFTRMFREANFFSHAHGFMSGQPTMGIIDLLKIHFPSFKDIGFDKRCRLLVVLYHGRAMSSDGALTPIADIKTVEPIADYQVAKALCDCGIIEYSPYLKSKIGDKIFLEAGGDEEVEIRTYSVEAVNGLMGEINRRRPMDKKINICHLDYRLWQAGRNSLSPHHLCLTTNY